MDVFTFIPRHTQTKFTRRQRERGQRHLSPAPSARQEPPRHNPYTLIPKPKPRSATPEPSSRAVSESEARDSFLWHRAPAKSHSFLAPAAEACLRAAALPKVESEKRPLEQRIFLEVHRVAIGVHVGPPPMHVDD